MNSDNDNDKSLLELSLTTQHNILSESKNESKFDDNNDMQSEDIFVQTENPCNITNIESFLECDTTSIINKIDSHINVTCDTVLTNEIVSVMSEEMNEKSINNAELKNVEDIESINSTYVHYNWSIAPKLLCTATEEYKPTNFNDNFTKGCQWSPDGTCLLVPSEDYKIHIYELPRELYSGQVPPDFMQTNFTPALTIKEGGLIYDTCWYPFMNSWQPTSCCFLSTSKESPTHLWDAFTGELRATYRAYNQMDEIEASISVQFVDSGRQIWCGFKNIVRTFDTNYPGRQTNTIEFKQHFPNMIGLVSCIRENPTMPGLVALGTYSKYIGLYKDGPLCIFKARNGITQVEFSSCGTKLFSACRKNNEFLCWDLRNPGDILYSFEGRQSDTNQKIQFDIMCNNKQIISGGTDGNINVWELSDIIDLNPKYKIKLSQDCINGTSLHKTLPIIATSSGQRQCGVEVEHRDNSVKLWWVL